MSGVKYFTAGRKFPQLLGRTPSGGRIPGGPYTVTQAIGGLATLGILAKSMFIWGQFGFWMNLGILAGGTYGAVFGLGKVPIGSRSPVSWGLGAFSAATRPRFGELRSSPIKAVGVSRTRQSRLLIQPSAGTAPAMPTAMPPAVPVAVPAAVPLLVRGSLPPTPAPDESLAILPGLTDSAPKTKKARGRTKAKAPVPMPAPAAPVVVQLSGVQLLLAAPGRPGVRS